MTNPTPRLTSRDTRSSTDENPLFWWKTETVNSLGSDCNELLKQALHGLVLLDVPRWTDACDGNTAVAISIAIPAIGAEAHDSPRLDLIMSSILLCTLNGNSAAAVVLAYALRKRGIHQGLTSVQSRYSLNAFKFVGDRS